MSLIAKKLRVNKVLDPYSNYGTAFSRASRSSSSSVSASSCALSFFSLKDWNVALVEVNDAAAHALILSNA